MTQLDVKAIPQVAMDFMNDDHQEAVEIMNQVRTALVSGTNEEIGTSLKAFFTHNKEHFAREEEQMVRFNFPPYSCHKGEHDRVLAELDREIDQWEADSDREKLGAYLNDTVVNWFLNHINTMDTVTAMFINQHAS